MTQRIPTSFIQELLARSDIVEIIRSRINLIKRGDNHQARCPFHEEKTPSFSVSQSKQFYYCFGCSASGNAIGFLMAFDHFDFREAVTHLAGLLNLEIPSEINSASVGQDRILYETLEEAARFYQRTLRNNPTAVQYLKSRGVSGEIAKTFGLGYAHDGWQQLQQHVGQQPDRQSALISNGLVIKKEQGQSYDRFRARIMFPIRNIQGQIIGFGGRTLGNAQPKYMNSPDTPLFHKGSEVYGLYEARQHKTQLNQLLLVEGYMDVVALHQHQIHYAVASMGTAVTFKQLQKLFRYTDQLIFCFDGDRAGRLAAWKALIISLPLLRESIRIKFLFLPEKEDPDSLVRKEGGAAFAKRIEQAMALNDFFFAELKEKIPIHNTADKAHYGQQAAQYLNTIPQGLFRQLLYDHLAQELQISAETLTEYLQPAPKKTQTTRRAHAPRSAHVLLPPAHLATSLILHQPELTELVTDMTWLHEIEAPGKKLLLNILQLLKQQPELTTGELLAYSEEEEERQVIAMLAARKPGIASEAMKAEFLGALASLQQHAAGQAIHVLVEKVKNSQLNLEEKQQLQILLAKIKKDASER